MGDGAQPVFFLDLADPHCYLAAEQVLRALPELAEWLPVTGVALGIAAPRARLGRRSPGRRRSSGCSSSAGRRLGRRIPNPPRWPARSPRPEAAR